MPCQLLTYPLAGWLGEAMGMPVTLTVLGILAALGTVLALLVWPAADPGILTHSHPDLEPGHPHLADGRRTHSHSYVIDDLHRHWPVASNGRL